MKGFVTKALANCGRVVRNTAQHPQRVLRATVQAATKVAPKLTSSTAKKTTGGLLLSGNLLALNNARRMSQITLEALPQEITWLSGAPGAGKGTNSKFISEICGYSAPTIVVSSLLEQPEFKHIKDAGGIVDDAAVFKVLSEELAKPKYRNGVVVDGFPRTPQQAEWLASLHQNLSSNNRPAPKFNFVMLYVNEETSVARQLARGEAVRAENSILKSIGGPLQEERATDLCGIAAKVRYQGFISKYQAISETLEGHQFNCSVVDASHSFDVVRNSLEKCLKNNNNNNNNELMQPFLQSQLQHQQQQQKQQQQQQFVVSSLYSDAHMQHTSQLAFA